MICMHDWDYRRKITQCAPLAARILGLLLTTGLWHHGQPRYLVPWRHETRFPGTLSRASREASSSAANSSIRFLRWGSDQPRIYWRVSRWELSALSLPGCQRNLGLKIMGHERLLKSRSRLSNNNYNNSLWNIQENWSFLQNVSISTIVWCLSLTEGKEILSENSC